MRRQSDTAFRFFATVLPRAFGFVAFLGASLAPTVTETAVANGDTRTINLFHVHTQESISATYLVNGQYDQAVLQQLNWFLRDWRRDEPTNMDPRLFDVVWETYRSAGAQGETVKVMSAYRSPETNAMLRSRSRAVAKHSQHMLGKAMDTSMPGMPMSRIREVGMQMQRGGVGYYPHAGTPFVHLDVGNVRSWPRMSYDQLARLFPDGKTVHLPTNGQPLARYEEARAEIEARGNGAYVTAPRRGGGLFAFLFGGGADEDEDAGVGAPAPSTRKQWASLAPRGKSAAESDEEGGAEAPPAAKPSRRSRAQEKAAQEIARAEANLPQGETVMTAAPAEAPLAMAPAEKAVRIAPPAEKAPEAERQQTAALPPREEKPTKAAPLPPERPASLAAPEKPTPLDVPTPPERPTAVAAKEMEDRLDLRHSDDIKGAVRVNAPPPPRRPASLAAEPSKSDGRRPETASSHKPSDGSALAHLMDATGAKARPGKTDSHGKPTVTTAAKTPPERPALAFAPAPAKPVADASAAKAAGLGGLRAAARAAAEKTH